MLACDVDGGALIGGDCGIATGDREAGSWKFTRQRSENQTKAIRG